MKALELMNLLEQVEMSINNEEARKILFSIEEKLDFFGLTTMYLDDYSFYNFSIPEITEALLEYHSLSNNQDLDLVKIVELLRSGESPEIMEIIYNSILAKNLKNPNFSDLLSDESLSPQQVIEKANQYPSILLGGNAE
jgi:hypothetical protein